MEFEFTAVIHCPPADVFALFRDIDQYNAYKGSPVPVLDKITDGPVGVGTRYREVVRMMPGIGMMPSVTVTILSEVTGYEPERYLASTWRSGAMEGNLAYTFEPVDDRTRVIQRMRLSPKGLLCLFSPLIKVMFARAASRRLVHIKALLEAKSSNCKEKSEDVTRTCA